MNPYIKYISIFLFIFFSKVSILGQTILCENDTPVSTNTFYLRFAEGALQIDGVTYSEDDVTLHALYKDAEKGMTCGGKVRFDKGESITMPLAGKDFLVTNGVGEEEGIFLVLQKDDGCILDSLSIRVSGNSEEQDSLIFRANRIIDIISIKAQTGDCLLTSTNEIPSLTSIKTYPNPTTENLRVELEVEESIELQYSLTNHLGQVIKSEWLSGKSIQETINLSHLPPSTYYLIFRQNGFVTTRKIVLMR